MTFFIIKNARPNVTQNGRPMWVIFCNYFASFATLFETVGQCNMAKKYNTGSTDSSIMHYAENYVFTLTDNERLYHVLNVVFIFLRFTGFKTCFNVLFFLRF